MTTTSARARTRRAAAAVSSGSLAVLALAAFAPAAEAASGTIDYACQVDGTNTPFTLPVVLDTTAPLRMTTGQSTQLSVTTKATLTRSAAVAIAGKPVTHVAATPNPSVTFGPAPPVATSATAPRTSLSESSPTMLAGNSTPFTYTAPATPGALEVTAGGLTGTMTLDNNDGVVTEKNFTCAAPNGKPPLIDTISISASTSIALTLSRSTSAYGQGVSASATVTSSAGTPAGEVAFTFGGVVTRARIGKDGVASLELPDAPVGTHTVWANFVPSDASAFAASTSVTKLLFVSKAEAKVRIPVTGRTTTTVTRVGAKVRGAFDTVPTGTVRIKVKRLGAAGKWVKNKTLNDAGAAKARLGRLTKGRYKVVVLYRGDANHLEARKSTTFRVTPG